MSTEHIEAEPEPLAGSVRFPCRCGFVIDSADYPPRTSAMQPDRYEKARKEHVAACPMRFDPPWPFDRLPMITRTLLGSTLTPIAPAATSDGSVAAGEPEHPTLLGRLFPSAPGWIRRRVGTRPFEASDFTT